jgi:hypothetical protein
LEALSSRDLGTLSDVRGRFFSAPNAFIRAPLVRTTRVIVTWEAVSGAGRRRISAARHGFGHDV